MSLRHGKTINPSTTTKFDSEFPKRWLDHAFNGGSIPEFCRQERICRQTFYNYCDEYPFMMNARRMGKTWAEGWWMEQARLNLVTHSHPQEGSTKFNDKIYTWTMAGRFGQTADKAERDMIAELMRRTAHLAQSTESPMALEAECEPDEEA